MLSTEMREKFSSHLEALRKALVGMAFAWILGAAVVAVNFSLVMELLRAPLHSFPNLSLITFSPLTALFIGFNIVGVGGAIVGAPLMILYAMQFFLPALKPNEHRIATTVACLAALLFIVGALFGFFWMLPLTLQIALDIQKAMGFQLLWSAQDYFSFVITLPLIMGGAFCIPLIVGVLLRVGVLNHAVLSRRWDVATLVILILAAALCPTGDPISFLFIAIPLGALYALALLLGKPSLQARSRP